MFNLNEDQTKYDKAFHRCEHIYANKSIKISQFSINGEPYPKFVPLYRNKSINLKCLNSSRNKKTILLWSKFVGLPLIKTDYDLKKLNCPINNCEITQDRDTLHKSDLVLFHLRNEINHLPSRAFETQRFVHVIYEAPIHCHLCDKFENFFNYSASYRKDSDYSSIYWTDSGLYWEESPEFDTDKNFANNKQYLVASLISNCKYSLSSNRNKFIKLLNESMPVHLFGECGKACIGDCYKYISQNFKFFLALENSFCEGYLTEKVFNWLNYDIIPIVYGYADYNHYIPKSAYINALDFESPHLLAKYLLYLDRNSTAYNEYFKWKRFIKSDFFSNNKVKLGFLCEMCIQLHLEDYTGIKYKQLDNLKQMFGLKETCVQVEFDNRNKKIQLEKNHHLSYSYLMSSEELFGGSNPLIRFLLFITFVLLILAFNFIFVLIFQDVYFRGFKTKKISYYHMDC